ncbi:hypothetical protein GIB67_027430, partial [Kingdonia uniflora]
MNYASSDTGVWTKIQGIFSASSAYEWLRNNRPRQWGCSIIWKSPILPKVANFGWRYLINNAFPTGYEIYKRGVILVFRCYLCGSHIETIQHLLWDCKVILDFRHWIC